MTEFDRSVSVPCGKASLLSFAQTLLVWRRKFGSGVADLLGEDFVGDAAEERLTGLFAGDASLTSIRNGVGYWTRPKQSKCQWQRPGVIAHKLG